MRFLSQFFSRFPKFRIRRSGAKARVYSNDPIVALNEMSRELLAGPRDPMRDFAPLGVADGEANRERRAAVMSSLPNRTDAGLFIVSTQTKS